LAYRLIFFDDPLLGFLIFTQTDSSAEAIFRVSMWKLFSAFPCPFSG